MEGRRMVLTFSISPANHIYCDLSDELKTLDMEGLDTHTLNIKELITSFKRKSYLMMPGRHTGLVNAHVRFEELNIGFLKLLDHSLELKDMKRADVLPGEVNTKKFEFVIPLKEGSAKLWRKAITKTYKDIVTEPREKLNIKERRFSVIERRGSIVEALGNKQEWMEFLEKLKNGLGDAFMQGNNKKRKISMVGQTQCKFVQVIPAT